MALHQLGLSPGQFGQVLGLEDSESGIVAIRAAGIALAVAVPFAQTLGHDLSAAARACPGGLPELMFEHKFFLKTD
jgi:beta-phosphoglucomutase-like phosphatase (HAD superfamily)